VQVVANFKPVEIYVQRQTDRQASEAAINSISDAGLKVVNTTYRRAYIDDPLDLKPDSTSAELDAILGLDSVLIERFSYQLAGCTLTVNRSAAECHDKLILIPDPKVDLRLFTRLIGACRQRFRPVDGQAVLDHLTDDQSRYLELRATSLHRLEAMQDDFFKKLQDFTLAQAKESERRRQELEEEFNTRALAVDQQYKEKQDALDKERTAIEEEKRSIDLRDNTIVRREIIEEVKKMLAERAKHFELSDNAQSRRKPIAIAYCALIGSLGALGLLFLICDLFTGNPAAALSPWIIARELAFMLGCALSVGFFIRWLNRWAQQHADEEFYSKRFELLSPVLTVRQSTERGEHIQSGIAKATGRSVVDSGSQTRLRAIRRYCPAGSSPCRGIWFGPSSALWG
jgi:hypothetical protein